MPNENLEVLLEISLSLPWQSQQPVVKPLHCLVESLLLGKRLHLLGQVGPDSEAVHNTREKVDLVRLARLLQDLLRLVALLGREDGVGLGGRNRERPGNGRQLVLFHKRRVGNVAYVDAVLIVTDDILRR